MFVVLLISCITVNDCFPDVLYEPTGEPVTSREECTDGVVVACIEGTCAGEEGYTCEVPPERFTDWLLTECEECNLWWRSANSPTGVPLAMVAQCEVW